MTLQTRPPQERFKPGDVVRYAGGVSALFRYTGTHNCDRIYGDHVLGGAHSACDMLFSTFGRRRPRISRSAASSGPNGLPERIPDR